MSPGTILWLVGLVGGAVSLAQLPSLGLALFMGEPWESFALAIAIGGAGSALLWFANRTGGRELDHRSAFVAVTLCWLTACVLAALPLYGHSGLGLSLVDAFFESTSGFTTTGATVLTGLDHAPRSVLLWRSVTQWLGGMGIVVLGVAVFPLLGVGGMQLFKAEAPGPTKDKLTPRIGETARLLWVLYLGLTVADALLLWVGGMGPFDAICHAMSTISTGGFSTHDASLGHYESSFILSTTTLFMLLGGMSFVILHRALTRGIPWSDSPELKAYVGIVLGASLLITLDLRNSAFGEFDTTRQALEHGVFQVASILTTTGFTTLDFDRWPPLSHAVLFGLLFIGAMSGSTGGGIKVIRVVLVLRIAASQFFRLTHPRGFRSIKLGKQNVDDTVLLGVLGFFGMWMAILFTGTAVLCAFGSDLFTSLSAAAATLGNVGPAFEGVGPSHNYAGFSDSAKLSMAALMLLGRLEIYVALVILTPVFWRR